MNWGQAKTILILAFLFLNVLLGYQLWSDRFSPTASEQDLASLKEETEAFLKAKQITVKPAIPKDMPKLATVNVRYPQEFLEPKRVDLVQPIRFSNLEDRSTLRELETETGIRHFAAYRLDPALSGAAGAFYHQVYGGWPMFDVTLTLYTIGKEIKGYKQTYVEVKSEGGPSEASGQKILSAYAAVRTLAESYLSEGTVITDIRLGYHGQLFDTVDQTFVPNWRVMLTNGDVYYVHAFTGAVEAMKARDD